MNLSRKRLSFGALVADFYCVGIFVGAIQGLYVAGARKPVPLWLTLFLLLVYSIVLLIYHAKVASGVRWLSVGETIFGRRIRDGKKWWINPYSISRGLFFAFTIVVLITWGNLWDSVSHETHYSMLTFPVVLGRIGFLSAGIYGLVRVGQGKSWGAYVVASVLAISALGNLKATGSTEVPGNVMVGIAIAGVATALLAVGIGLYYARHVEAASSNMR